MDEPSSGGPSFVNAAEDRLDSWKEIAAYLSRDVTTVQRWEKREGMPVHRHIHDKVGSVYASRAELDTWARSRNVRAAQESGNTADLPGSPPELPVVQARHTSHWSLAIAAAAAVVVLLATVLLLNRRRGAEAATPPAIKSLAVLPLKNLSGDAGQDYLADGMTEELIGQLANIRGLRVISRTSVMRFKDTHESVPEIVRQLHVDAVLEGSVMLEGNLVRVHAQLIRGATDEHIWAQEYQRENRGLLALQEEVAQTIARQVGASATAMPAHSQTTNPDAYQAYLQARYFRSRGGEKEDFDKAVAYADRAIELDANYSPAWALRATTLSEMAGEGFIDADEGFRRARADAEHAIALDPTLAAGYVSLASIHINYDLDWEATQASLDKAAALQSGSADLLGYRSNLQDMLGRLDESIEFQKQAIALDPLSAAFHAHLGDLFYRAGRYEEANAAFHKALELNPEHGYIRSSLCQILLAQGDPQGALAEMRQESVGPAKLTDAALVYHALDRDHESDAALTALIASHSNDSAYQVAEVYAYRGESDKAFAWLERAYQQHDSGMNGFKADPLFDPLHQDPRYTGLLKKMRLPL